MKIKNLILFALILTSGCFNARKSSVLTSEPSIERAMDILAEITEGEKLIQFLNENPVQFEYSNTAGLCHKLAFSSERIYIARNFRKTDLLLALEVGRAAYIYRLYKLSGFDDIVSEEEELAALFTVRTALELNVVEEDLNYPCASKIKRLLCLYITQNANAVRREIQRKVLSEDSECGYPLDTLENQLVWLEKIKNSAGAVDLFQILYERDLRKVKKGSMTLSEAIQRDAKTRGLSTYDLYRYQRTFYDDTSEMINSFSALYKKEVQKDSRWREKNAAVLERAMLDFPTCQF